MVHTGTTHTTNTRYTHHAHTHTMHTHTCTWMLPALVPSELSVNPGALTLETDISRFSYFCFCAC